MIFFMDWTVLSRFLWAYLIWCVIVILYVVATAARERWWRE
jgi:hypothetical protein